MTKKKAAPSKTMVQEVFALAEKMGWTHLNDQEKRLIQLLRYTTYHGRNLVVATAEAANIAHPWRHGDSSGANTDTFFPANKCRFFTLPKEA